MDLGCHRLPPQRLERLGLVEAMKYSMEKRTMFFAVGPKSIVYKTKDVCRGR